MLKLLIVRHGNTFDKGEIIRRVGLKTDLPLSKSGIQQCHSLSLYIDKHYPKIDKAYCSELRRTQQTGQLILKNQPTLYSDIKAIKALNEIDYGLDEGKPEEEVIKRIGTQALIDWDTKAIVPNGWLFSPSKCQQSLHALVKRFTAEKKSQTILLITSNGIARFFPTLLTQKGCIDKAIPLKLPTASISELTYDDPHQWQCSYWGVIP